MKKLIFVLSFILAISGVRAERNPDAVSRLLDRVGGPGASALFITELDTTLAHTGEEVFVISSEDAKPLIKGSTLSALTAGIGWYLNHYAGINITWNNPVADFATITFPLPQEEERHTTNLHLRHYFNYCTFSYSAPMWDRERWQREVDWMALRGINMPLMIVGVEEVWRRLLDEYGYDEEEINSFVAGPAYQAWFQMGNVEGIGGPNPAWWYRRQGRLGREVSDMMRQLGMDPVFPGFYFVPSGFSAKSGLRTYPTGDWNGYPRPHLPDVSDNAFVRMAQRYYRHLNDVLGDTKYYSLDPFHEGLPVVDREFSPSVFYSGVFDMLDSAHPDAVWVIQHWQWNRAQWQCLDAIPVGRLLVLDLFADARPHWSEMRGHDVVYSTIFNFGGRTGLFGRLATTAEGFDKARTSSSVKGIGATPEAIGQTPIIYDMLFELPWYEGIPDLDQWIADYTVRRYGKSDRHALKSWQLLGASALACPDSRQGPHEAIMCARPSLSPDRVSTWGSADIFYDPAIVHKAAFELLEADIDNDNYRYDLADVARQALTDYSKILLGNIAEAHASGDSATFAASRDRFLELILDVDDILSTVPDFILGSWTDAAAAVAAEGDSSADLEWLDKENARALITTWYSRDMAESLHDYSYRQWAGMLSDFYYPRWKVWFDRGMNPPDEGWYEWESRQIRKADSYPATPRGDTREVVRRILLKYFPD